MLVDPTVPSAETLHSLPSCILVAGRWPSGYERKVGSSFSILEEAVHSKFPIKAREVTKEAPQFGRVAVHNWSIYEGCDGVHLLSLQSVANIRPKIDGAGWCGAIKSHAALCTSERVICLQRRDDTLTVSDTTISLSMKSICFLFQLNAYWLYHQEDLSYSHVWHMLWFTYAAVDQPG